MLGAIISLGISNRRPSVSDAHPLARKAQIDAWYRANTYRCTPYMILEPGDALAIPAFRLRPLRGASSASWPCISTVKRWRHTKKRASGDDRFRVLAPSRAASRRPAARHDYRAGVASTARRCDATRETTSLEAWNAALEETPPPTQPRRRPHPRAGHQYMGTAVHAGFNHWADA